MNRYREEFQMSNDYVAEVYAGRYNTELESLDNYISNIYMENLHFRMLQRSELTEKNRISAEYHLNNMLSSKAHALQRYGCLFYYDTVHHRMRSCYSTLYSTDLQYRLNQELAKYLSAETEWGKPHIFSLAGKNCYMKSYGNMDCYVGFFIDLEQYFLDVTDWGKETGVQMLICDDAGKVWANYGTGFLTEEVWSEETVKAWRTDEEKIVSITPLYGQEIMLLHVRSFGQLAYFWRDIRMWMFLVILPLAGAVFSCVVFHFFRKILLFPTERLVVHIRQLESGEELSETVKANAIMEFQEIGDRIDEMVEKIGALQDTLYREKLDRQSVQLQCFQLQIKPHFYLNCLKEMDALLETGEYQTVKSFVICLAEYIRGRFQQMEHMVPLRDELKASYAYYCLRTMLYNNPVLYRDEVPEKLKKLMVPPFCVQLLVENSFKYAYREEQILSVRIQASLVMEEGQEYLLLRVSDNGVGYKKEQMQEWMDKNTDFKMHREHIGIFNLIYRLRLLYYDTAKTVFYNQPSGGAVTELFLPIMTTDQEEDAEEETDTAGSCEDKEKNSETTGN